MGFRRSITKRLYVTAILNVLLVVALCTAARLAHFADLRDDRRIRNLHEQRTSSLQLSELTARLILLLHQLIDTPAPDESERMAVVLAESEDLQAVLSRLEDIASESENSEDAAFVQCVEPAIGAVRNDAVRCLELLREGRRQEARAYWTSDVVWHLEPLRALAEEYSRTKGIHVDEYVRALELSKQKVLLTVSSIAATLLILTAAVNVSVARSISGPLGRLLRATRLVAAGDLAACPDPTGRDEIAELTESFNNMVAQVQEHHEELTAANENLIRAHSDVIAATRAKSAFLANMSHEIRTPMTAILGFADVLSENARADNVPSEIVEAIETIQRNGRYLLGLINDILDLSKIEAGEMTMEKLACSPCQVLAEVASLMRVSAEARGLQFGIEYDGAIPETIHTDPTRLRQILINTVGNSIKFTRSGSVRIICRLVHAPRGPLMQFDVEDTGCGIAPEQVARLFRPFTQADISITRQHGGTGLGLAISRRFAEMLGGDMAVVRTQLDVGTCLRATVATGPLEGVKMIDDPDSATVLAAGPAETSHAAAPNLLQGCRILLAEDGPDNRRLISHILEKAGAAVTLAENGRIAVDAALAARDAGTPFDVILMDMQMPIMDGYESTAVLRSAGYAGPIVALTAHAMEGDREKCRDAGCDDYATKPIDRKKLIEAVRQYLEAAATAC